jgi:hypothetical protein
MVLTDEIPLHYGVLLCHIWFWFFSHYVTFFIFELWVPDIWATRLLRMVYYSGTLFDRNLASVHDCIMD